MNKSYEEFIATKLPLDIASGLKEIPELPSTLKPFQAALTRWALQRGRAALLAGTGLGKTLMQLAWADAIATYENKPLLILTPLAVAEQSVSEATKFGIEGVRYAADQKQAKSRINITNYERFDKFDINSFCGIVLDESSILKSVEGKTRKLLTEACAHHRWRLCCSATPAPNDYTEIGQHAEFLSIMTAPEMLAMFFVHDGGIRANIGETEWRLKRHAEKAFWQWMASWAAVVNSPSDLGFDEPDYILPPLSIEQITVATDRAPPPGYFFPVGATTLSERIKARRETATERVSAAVDLVKQNPDVPWLIWCNLNTEADEIEQLLDKSEQVAGRHTTEIKTLRLLGFKDGKPLYLVSKPSIAGHGMNWQHCSHMIFVGLTDSFEQVFQAIRRCWRFGQAQSVKVYMIAADSEGAVVENLNRKEDDYNKMIAAMSEYMRDLVRVNVIDGLNSIRPVIVELEMVLPQWL